MANDVVFKMMKTNSKTSMILLISILLTHLSCATITIEITPTEVTTNANFIISCYVGTLTQDVIFFKDNIEIGKCTPSPLPGVVPIFCVSGFSQDPTTNITKYSVTTANATINEGTWKCVHNTETSNTLPLTVYGFPSNPIDSNQAYLPNKIDATNMDSTQFTVNVSECVNPAPTISWTFYQKCDGTSINSIPITSTTSDDPDVDCSSPYSAYKNTVKVSDMKKLVDGDLCLNVRSVVGYTGTSFSNKIVTFLQNITFTSVPPKSNTNCLKHVLCCFLWALLGNVIGIVIVLIFNCIKGVKCKETCEEVTWTLLISFLYDMVIPMPACYYLCPDNAKWDMIAIVYGLLITLIVACIAYKYVKTRGFTYLMIIFTLTIVGLVVIVVACVIWVLLTESYLNILKSNKTISLKCGTTVVLVIFEAGYEDGQWKKSALKKKGDVQNIRAIHLCKILPPVLIFWNIKKEDEGVYYCESGISKSKELTIEVNGESPKKTNSRIKDEESAMNFSTESSPIKDEESAMNLSTERGSTNSIMPEKHSSDDNVLVNNGIRLPPILNPNGTNEINENEKAKTKKKQLKKEKKRRKNQENNPVVEKKDN